MSHLPCRCFWQGDSLEQGTERSAAPGSSWDSQIQHTSVALSIKVNFGIFNSSKLAEPFPFLAWLLAMEVDKDLITVIILITAVLNKD